MRHSLLDRVASKVKEAEVFESSSDVIEVSFSNGQVKGALARESSGIALRAIRDGRLGFAASTDRTPAAETKLVENLLGSIALGDEAGFSFPKKLPAPSVDLDTWDEKTAKLGPADLVAIGNEIVAAVKERHPDVALDVSLRRAVSRARLENSNGGAFVDQGSSVSVSVEFNRTRESDVLLDDEGFAGVRLTDQVDRVIARLVEKLDRARKDAKLERSGNLPVLFSPNGSYVVWMPVFQGLSGKSVQTGTSPLREKLGRTFLDRRVHLVDAGLKPGFLGSAPFDDEGTPRRDTVLVENGTLRSFVHDLKTASATKQTPTGNAERPGVLGQPGPGFTNLTIRPGTKSESELLRSIDHGLLVESVIGLGQGNVMAGAFSNTVGLAYLVEKGEVVGRVKDVSIAGNAYEVLESRLGELGRDLDTSSGSMAMPALLVSSLSVVGKT